MSSQTQQGGVHKVLKEWFTKKGGKKSIIGGSKKRWFVLEDQMISYYEKPDQKKQLGSIYLEQINKTKINNKELILFTAFRNYSLTHENNVNKVIEWADAIEMRLKQTETLRKVTKKAEKLVERQGEVEKVERDLREYIDYLVNSNESLSIENELLRKQLNMTS